jgi:Beta-carotene isomerase D27-like, C-terminal
MLLQFFRETLGLDMTMKPDYDTFECKLRYVAFIVLQVALLSISCYSYKQCLCSLFDDRQTLAAFTRQRANVVYS